MNRNGAAAGPRVLMVDSERSWRGGENQLLLLMRGLCATSTAHVALAAPPGAAIARRAAELGVPCLPLSMHGGLDVLAAAIELRRHLGAGRFDIVHCHASRAHSIAFLALAPARLRRAWRSRRRTRRADGRRDAAGDAGRGARGRLPFLVVSRRVDFPFARRGLSALKYRHGADLYLAISTGVRDVLVRCGVEPARIELVRSGIDLERHRRLRDTRALRRELGITDGTFVVGNVAALAPHKAQADFVRAARLVADALPAVRFFIVGDGAERPRLEALVRTLGLSERLLLTGFRDDALEILSLFDCFVLSSTLEGLCTSIMDAQALGVAVVATRTGGVPDLVEDGRTGLLVSPGQPAQLAAAILRLLQDAELRARCVGAARARADTYGYEHMVRGTLTAYARLLGKVEQ